MWIYKAGMSLNSGDRHEQMPSNTGRSRPVGPIHIHLHHGFLPSGEALGFIVLSSREPPTVLHQIQQSKAQQQHQNRVQSATIIQAAWRGYRVRRGLEEMNRASVKIQAAWRGYRVRRGLEEMNRASVKIQAAWRGYRVRRGLEEMNRASVKIQAAWRGYRVRRGLEEMNRASVKIQAAWRGYRVRRGLEEMNRASVKIQAAWRGYQVRRELDEMNKAAVKIQAAYRGHRTRQALPLGFYNCLRDKRAAMVGKNKEEDEMMSVLGVPGTLECNMWCEEMSHVPAATLKTESPAGRCRDRHGASSDVIPGAAVYSPEVYLTPSKAVNHEDNLFAFEILPAVTSEQQVQNAADKIQAAEGLDKMERPAEKKSEQNLVLAYSCQLKQNFCENVQNSDICSITGVLKWTSKPKDMVPYSKQNLTAQLEMKRGKKASDAESEAPSIRKVEVHTVVRNLPASQRCPISLHVSSPNGTVECSQKDIAMGQLRGMYAVRGLRGSQPAYVSICISVVEVGRKAGGSSAW